MISVDKLMDNIKYYIGSQIESMSNEYPLIAFTKPLITRALNKNYSKVQGILNLISDNNGNLDIEAILSEMTDNLLKSKPFSINTSFIGDIEIGGGQLKLNIPFSDKKLVLGTSDFETFQEIITSNKQ